MDKNSLYSVEYIPSRGKNKGELTNLYYTNKELIVTRLIEKDNLIFEYNEDIYVKDIIIYKMFKDYFIF